MVHTSRDEAGVCLVCAVLVDGIDVASGIDGGWGGASGSGAGVGWHSGVDVLWHIPNASTAHQPASQRTVMQHGSLTWGNWYRCQQGPKVQARQTPPRRPSCTDTTFRSTAHCDI